MISTDMLLAFNIAFFILGLIIGFLLGLYIKDLFE